jgi:coenzyme F420-dependent glucose-6-phosphate dehydrogenase
MHPAIVAHAAATAAVMLEERFFLGVGTGERSNEHVTGQRWPGATERREMLREAVGVIRSLLEGDNVNHRGEHSPSRTPGCTRSTVPPPIMVAATGRRSARLAAEIGDGLIAVAPDPAQVYVHQIGPDQDGFLRFYRKHVLPQVS